MRFPIALLLMVIMGSCKSGTKDPPPVSRSAEPAPDFFSFVKADSVNPVLVADSTQIFTSPIIHQQVRWEEKDVFNPAAVVRNDTLFLLYRAEDRIGKHAGTSRIGVAWSTDGFHFTKHPVPVLYPDNDAYKKWEWEGGCEDPRVVQDDKGIYYMTYTAYDGQTARMMVASSANLFQWTKHGHVFEKTEGGRYTDKWTKSGSILSRYINGTPVAAKVNGKYWMYGGDVNIWVASSTDLIHWTPELYGEGEKATAPLRRNASEIAGFRIVLAPREHKFDSDLVEPGPPAMLTDSAILLVYNSRNTRSTGDTSLPEGAYTAGYAVIDINDPTRVRSRTPRYFMKPDRYYETIGQVNQVCFIEGLVKLRGKWFMYYGTADSRIAVAVN